MYSHAALTNDAVRALFYLSVSLGALSLTACGGGGGSDGGGGGGGAPPPNQAPVAAAACHSIVNNQNEVIANLNATDPNGDTLNYTVTRAPGNGTVDINPAGVFTYRPNANGTGRRGMDKFTYQVTDSGGLTSSATVTVLNNGQLRIMPLGDSITEGFHPNGPGDGQRTGYRRRLHLDLEALSSGYSVNFVGAEIDGQLDHDREHQGLGGWCSTAPCSSGAGIDQNVHSWLNANPADVVLLHIGTNDLGDGRSSATGVAAILNEIDRWEAANHPVTVFLAQIIGDVPGYGSELAVSTFNCNLASMINGGTCNLSGSTFSGRPNDRVLLVNMQSGAGLQYGSGTPGADMDDNLHPSASGYDKMANKWRTDLTNPANAGAKFVGMPSCP